MTGTSTSMEAQRAFLSAVSSERQKSWNKAEANYEEVLRLMYKMKWRKHFNKEKLRLLLFECHFHCAVALQNLQNYQKALRHFRRAMEVVSWRKDECQAGCITGRVLHLHVPTLARMSYCHIHIGDLTEALKSIDRAILLDFRNPDLFCVRSLVKFLLNREEKALSDAGFAIQLSPTQVCGWLLRGLFKKIKKEGNEVKTTSFKLLEHDLEKACEVNPDAVLFIHVKDLRTHFQALFDRFLPSIRVSHSVSVRDIIDTEVTAKARSGRVEWRQTFLSHTGNLSTASQKTMVLPSSPTFMCGVAKPQPRVQTCPPQDDRHTRRKLERFSTEPSISHHKYSLNISSELTQRTALHSRSACKSRDPNVTLRDVVSAKSACVCRDKKVIGVKDFRERDEEDQEHNEDLPYVSERMYSSCDFVELTDSAGQIIERFSGYKPYYNVTVHGSRTPCSAGQRIERFSGYKPYYNVTVHGSRTQLLRVIFTSDSSVRRKGFLAQYHMMLYETMQILQQIEDQLVSPTPTQPSNIQMAKRAIRELPDPQELVKLLEKI